MKKILLICCSFLFLFHLIAQTRIEMKSSDLDKKITQYISKQYPDYSIDKAFKVDANKVITFEIFINKEEDQIILFFDKDNKFLRKELLNKKDSKTMIKK